MNRKTIKQIQDKKKHNEKISMLTAYDYQIASLLDAAGIDIVLVGDSLANVVLGLESTNEVGMDEMIHHAKAVNRAVKKAMVIGDMPFDSYQINSDKAIENAKRFILEAGCNAVKIEWFDGCLEVVANLVKAKVPVMGHVGLTPQTVEALGGYKVQGRDIETAEKIIEQAKSLQYSGCFGIVLECIPQELAKIITQLLYIPTISCGAGVFCDGQVVVTNDMLGLTSRHNPKFVKQYINLNDLILNSMIKYRQEIEEKEFPGDYHSYHMDDETKKKLSKKYDIIEEC